MNMATSLTATMLCGDFNIKAGSRGYQLVVDSNEYDDQYLSANSPQIFRKIFEVRDLPGASALDDDHRIDYVFLRKGSKLRVTSGRVVFTDQDYGTSVRSLWLPGDIRAEVSCGRNVSRSLRRGFARADIEQHRAVQSDRP
jgi:endonuclease/exonuclease/phosphatase family metal-dependent hydrolase